MYFIMRFDVLPGKMSEVDKFLDQELLPYWLSHNEVHSVQVFEDKFIGWPERTVMIEIDDMCALQSILSSSETRQMKEHFTSYAGDIQTQIMDKVSQKP
ncbi:MAG: hypothetical protein AB1847_01040 [bacterium]